MNRHFPHRNPPHLLLCAREALMAHFRPILNQAGGTEQQWRVLRTLSDQEPMKPNRIAARSRQIDPDSRRPRKVFDTADNAANAGVALDGRPVRIHEVDLRWVGAILSRNAVVKETGLAAGVLHHPANGVVWLANKLGPLARRMLNH